MNTYDLIILGGGPGGYSAAFRAAELLRGIETIESVFCVNDSEGLRKREGIQICRKKNKSPKTTCLRSIKSLRPTGWK